MGNGDRGLHGIALNTVLRRIGQKIGSLLRKKNLVASSGGQLNCLTTRLNARVFKRSREDMT